MSFWLGALLIFMTPGEIPEMHPCGNEWAINDFSYRVAYERYIEEECETNDYELLAQMIWAEARGGSEEMKYAVGSVALNRVKSDRFPDTLKDVIYQEGQYESAPILGDTDEECRRIAAELIENGSTLPDYCVWCAEFPQGEGTYTVIGNQYICY